MRLDKYLLKSVIDQTIYTTEEDTLAAIDILTKLAFPCNARKPRYNTNIYKSRTHARVHTQNIFLN